MRKAVRGIVVCGAFLVCSSIVFGATAALVPSPKVGGKGGEYDKGNGKVEIGFGKGESTFAVLEGKMNNAKEITKREIVDGWKESLDGSVVDYVMHEGLIVNAEIPLWKVKIKSKMTVAAGGYRSNLFTGQLSSKYRGVLALGFDAGSGATCREVRTTNEKAQGPYDISETINGNIIKFPNGGSIHSPANDFRLGGGFAKIIISKYFSRRSAGIRFSYESRGSFEMYIKPNKAGKETVNGHVKQIGGQWQGTAEAWDDLPTGPVLVKRFILR